MSTTLYSNSCSTSAGAILAGMLPDIRSKRQNPSDSCCFNCSGPFSIVDIGF